MGLDGLVLGGKANAILGWCMAAVVTITAVASFVSNASLWAGFSLVLVAVIALPATATRDWKTMAPWPVLSVGAVAVTLRAAGMFPDAAGYVAIAILALIVVVELDVFTQIHLSRRFAVGFTVLTTMALEALWIVAQFLSDRWLGTGFLSTLTELQEDIVAVTAVSLAIGAVFYWYLARIDPVETADDPLRREEAT